MVELLLAVVAVAAEPRPFADVDPLEIGAGRKDHVGKLRLALEPDRLVDHEFELVGLVHPHVAIGIVHGREDRAAVFVEHLHRRMAGRRIGELCELVLDRLADPAIAFRLAVDDRLRQPDARDGLAVGAHRRKLRHALVERDRHGGVLEIARHAAFAVAREVEIEIERAAPLQIAHVDAGLAEPLHRREAHHHARPLDAGLVAAGAAVAVAPAAGREIDALLAPFTRQRTHVPGGNTGLLLLPFRRLGNAVLLADEIGLPFVETDRVGLDVGFVVEAFLDPHVGDGHGHGDRGGGLGREPLARQELRRGIIIRVDVDDLDPELGILQPLPAHGAFLRPVGTGGGFGVGGPEHDHVAVLQTVLDRAVGLRLADAQRVAPVMHRAPVPAFPGIRIVVNARETDRVAEAEQRGEVVADIAPGVMRTMRHRDGARAVVALHPFDLAGHEVERLLPGDARITGLAAVLRIARAVRIEIDALHRVEQPVGRIDHRLAVLTVRRQRGLARRRQLQAARLDRPGRAVVLAEIDRRGADDLAVLDEDEQRPAVRHVAIAHGAVAHARAELEAGRHARHDGLGEPVDEIIRPLDGEVELLLRVDLVEPIDRRRQEIGAEPRRS